jgi:hypothetical protein
MTALSWHAFDGNLHIDVGAMSAGLKSRLTGTTNGYSYPIGSGVYATSDVASLHGEIKAGHSVVPYVGVGWGNPVSEWHRLSLLVDVGVLYAGVPKVSLSATCTDAIVNTPVCTHLQDDVQLEIQRLQANVRFAKWYPVISVGLGVRF